MKLFACCLLLFFVSCNDQRYKKPVARSTTPTDSAVAKVNTQNPFAPIDISPMDISYFPTDYPLRKMTKKANALPVARVIYSRPHKQGRKIFGNLLKYGEPWRMGANEATEIEFFQDITIQDKKISKGRYIAYCIPYENKWTIVLNSNLYSWGLKPDIQQNLYQFDVPVQHSTNNLEYFTIVFETAQGNSTNLIITWDDVLVRLPLRY